MVSPRGQSDALTTSHTASDVGEITVQEYGYGLGPPDGILVLRYPPDRTIPDFPEDRDDFLHQVFWSPDGVLVARRGGTARFVSSGEMLWVRRGVVAEVRGLGLQTVLRVCVRRAPAALTALPAAALTPDAQVCARLSALARPGVSEADGLRARVDILTALAEAPAVQIDHAGVGETPAHIVTRALLSEPADTTSLADWAERLHVSAKTLQRDLEREFATTFTVLRTRIRLRAAVALLHDRSVTETAHLVGYASASAFVAAFTREFGETPGRYVAGDHADSA
ncbi:helix-turn-helix transcriptional regulator [Nocardioides alcanivorans]|uniref:helix-turn-helix transcriptional regulator n=1 Tax=Nocardioides alcanivorans TaxID=2897352 RepID=UPI001F2E6D4C|nr:AraC family transcriptional regulator [Nocardioides alcanivorans]